jgi:transposase InsO family protein
MAFRTRCRVARWECRRRGFTSGCNGDGSAQRHRRKALAATIAWLFAKHKGTYGSPRIVVDLREMGWRVSVNTVAALMAEQGLVARRTRGRRGTTKPDKSTRKAPDLLGRDFTPPPQPNVAWVGDLTEKRPGESPSVSGARFAGRVLLGQPPYLCWGPP